MRKLALIVDIRSILKEKAVFLLTLNIGCATVLFGFVIVFLLAMAVSLFRFSPNKNLNKSEKTEIKKSPNK